MFVGSSQCGAGGSGGERWRQLMEAFKTNPTFLSLNLVVSAIVIAMIVERRPSSSRSTG